MTGFGRRVASALVVVMVVLLRLRLMILMMLLLGGLMILMIGGHGFDRPPAAFRYSWSFPLQVVVRGASSLR
jgi:hypothetical protein